jgi:hypothetical protein
MEISSFVRATPWYIGKVISTQVGTAITTAIAGIRSRLWKGSDIRVSRLSDEWLRTHESESAKHASGPR